MAFSPQTEDPVDRTHNKNTFARTTQTPSLDPTGESYQDFQAVFDFFNSDLITPTFGVSLPKVFITLPKSRRYKGYFHGRIWHKASDDTSRVSEIALNPIILRTDKAVCMTMCHEMIHHGQHEMPTHFGKPGKRGYHGMSFHHAMQRIGLQASATGKPGGAFTGVRMTQYLIEGGAFEQSFARYKAAGLGIRWSLIDELFHCAYPSTGTEEEEEQRNRQSKTKYACPTCQTAAWGKPGIRLGCIPCGQAMTESSTSNNGASHV